MKKEIRGKIKVKVIRVSDFLRGRTKWGADPKIKVSFQNVGDRMMVCFQGDGYRTKTIGWGKNKKEAIKNLLERMRYYDKVSFF